MSELRRWSEEGAAPEELDALAAMRREKPEASLHPRILGAMGVGVSVFAAASASTAAVSAAGGTSLLIKIGGGLLIVGLASGATWSLTRPRETPPATATSAAIASVAAVPAAAAPTASAPGTAEAPAASAAEPPCNEADGPCGEVAETAAPVGTTKPPNRARSAPSASTSARLTEEVAALQRARKALASKSPDEALRELGKYNKRFPHGALASEEIVLRVQAHLARGRHAEAVALADQYAAAHPESPYARRVQELVRSVRKK